MNYLKCLSISIISLLDIANNAYLDCCIQQLQRHQKIQKQLFGDRAFPIYLEGALSINQKFQVFSYHRFPKPTNRNPSIEKQHGINQKLNDLP
jgi:hypothetical protein